MNEQEIKARLARYEKHQQEQLRLYPLTKVVNLTVKTNAETINADSIQYQCQKS